MGKAQRAHHLISFLSELVMSLFDWGTIFIGILVFFARVADVSLGTMRTIAIVHGRTQVAFFLGFVEVTIWLVVIATVLQRVMAEPLLAAFYALGFSTGNVVGIKLEKSIAFGHTVLRVISPENGKLMAEKIRRAGYGVTTFLGEGLSGPVTELYVVCRRRELKRIIGMVNSIVPDAFYITEPAGQVSKIYRPIMQPLTGWRAAFKRK